jgi:uncharacterized protein YheU (UPF0270 family)
MELTVDTLDNSTKSAVINIGEDNGYIEAYLDDGQLHIYIYNPYGRVFSREILPVELLTAK